VHHQRHQERAKRNPHVQAETPSSAAARSDASSTAHQMTMRRRRRPSPRRKPPTAPPPRRPPPRLPLLCRRIPPTPIPVTASPPRQILAAKAATGRYKNLTPYPHGRGVYHPNQHEHDEYTRVYVSEWCHKEYVPRTRAITPQRHTTSHSAARAYASHSQPPRNAGSEPPLHVADAQPHPFKRALPLCKYRAHSRAQAAHRAPPATYQVVGRFGRKYGALASRL